MDSSATIESLQSLMREQSRVFEQLKENHKIDNTDDQLYLEILNGLDRISQLADKLNLPLLAASSILVVEITDEIFSELKNSAEQVSIVLSWLDKSQKYINSPQNNKVVVELIATLPQEYKEEMNELYFDSEIMDDDSFDNINSLSAEDDSSFDGDDLGWTDTDLDADVDIDIDVGIETEVDIEAGTHTEIDIHATELCNAEIDESGDSNKQETEGSDIENKIAEMECLEKNELPVDELETVEKVEQASEEPKLEISETEVLEKNSFESEIPELKIEDLKQVEPPKSDWSKVDWDEPEPENSDQINVAKPDAPLADENDPVAEEIDPFSQEEDPWADSMDFDDILAEEDVFDSSELSMAQILAKEFSGLSPVIKNMLEMNQLQQIDDIKQASHDCCVQLEKLLEAAVSAGYEGIQLVCKFLTDNVVDLQPLSHDDRQKRLQLVDQFLPVFIAHLNDQQDDNLCLDVLELTSLMGWVEPLNYTKQRALLNALVAEAELGEGAQTEARETTVSSEQVSLQISSDATPDLIDAFFVESPHYAENLTVAIGHIAKGEEVQKNVLSAQRISHTIKGSANLLGVSGVAILAHYLEDIFEYIFNHDITPDPELAYVMQEAADTIEMMIEAVEDGTGAPESALQVVQSVLDWINRLENNGEVKSEPFVDSKETASNDLEMDMNDLNLDIDIDIDEDLDEEISPSKKAESIIDKESNAEEIDPQVRSADIESVVEEKSRRLDVENEPAKTDEEPFAEASLQSDRNQLQNEFSELPIKVSNIKPIFRRKEIERKQQPKTNIAEQNSEIKQKSQQGNQSSSEPVATEMLRVPRDLIDNILNVVGEASISLGETLEKLQKLSDRGVHMRNLDDVLQTRRFELEDLVNVKGVSNQQKKLQVVNGRVSQSDFDSLEMDEYNEFYGATHSYIEAVADTRFVAREITDDVSSLETIFVQQRRLNRALQDMVMSTRMVAVSTIAGRMQRAVRQASRMTGKDAELQIIGEDLLIDGDVLAKLADPLMHILRNAVDHGIEDKQTRLEKDKNPVGQIQLTFEQLGNHITVSCNDDGMGLGYELILNKALEKNLVKDQQMDKNSIARLILLPGFSTRSDATQVSGRGVGMDVVNDTVTGLKGSLTIGDSESGGTIVSLRIPVTLLTNHSILVDAGNEQYAIPSNVLEQILTPGTGQIGKFGNMLSYRLARDSYPVKTLNGLLGLPELDLEDLEMLNQKPVILIQVDDQVTAVLVDNLISTFELVVKSCGKYVGDLEGVSGVSLLGNGQVVPVIDLSQLVRAGTQSVIARQAVVQDIGGSEINKILIVDDSLTVRNSLAELVGDAGYKAVLARDGLEALKELDKELPSLVLTDLEMPRMNGLELTSYIKTHENLSALPVVMITSRTMQKHRDQAITSGVNAYITKPYVPEDLMVLLSEQIKSGGGNNAVS